MAESPSSPGTSSPPDGDGAVASLNAPQREAVLHPGGPLLVLAGAGSGKTRVITHRLAELVRRGATPERVLAVTFTNKAARELRERAGALLGETAARLWIGTFHATCARLLRGYARALGLPRDFAIIDDAEQLGLLEQVIRELALGGGPLGEARALQAALDRAYSLGQGAAELVRDEPTLARACERYEALLRRAGAVDFGGLLVGPLRLARDPALAAQLAGRFDHVLVDEFQDVNPAQERLLEILCGKARELLVVGDDDQAIYGWRGADVRIILGFGARWPGAATVRLEENYRSTQVILDAANALIRRNRRRHDKTLFSQRKGGAAIEVFGARDHRSEAAYVAAMIQRLIKDEGRGAADFAICYRVNAQSAAFEEALRSAGLPYSLVGKTRLADRTEVRDLVGYLRLVASDADDGALRRVINTPSRGMGEATLQRLGERAAAGGVSLWAALCAWLDEGTGLNAAQREALAGLRGLIDELRAAAPPLPELAQALLERSGYLDALGAGREADERRGRLLVLIASLGAQRGPDGGPLTLATYLEQAALESAADARGSGVTLLTVHAAKGLEFPVVFVPGLEEGLFPSWRRGAEDDEGEVDPAGAAARREEEEAVEEERRLAYVALTRARERLFLSHAWKRQLYGTYERETEPSRFLQELPAACLLRREEPRSVIAAAPQKSAAVPGATGGFAVGQRVRHATFGIGEVRAVSGSGPQQKVSVYFADAGPKTLLPRFLTAE